ncbi:MAG: hypothetical protein QOE43_1648 [Gaiellaceae bacterium]|nr:hypothetical protein [Gaiellaceae bacterium]
MDEERLRQIEAEERARLEIRERLEAERRTATGTLESPEPAAGPEPAWAPPLGFPPPAAAPAHAPPAYDPRGYAPLVTPQKTNGLAVAGMVLGILWLYWIGSILALIFGYVAKGQIDASNGQQGGRGMAIAAIVLGWVGVGSLVLLLILGVGVASGA